jgi:hypothetical protein
LFDLEQEGKLPSGKDLEVGVDGAAKLAQLQARV